MGSLSQATKLYATNNILYTHLFCTAYLADYMVESMLLNLAAGALESTNVALPNAHEERQQSSILRSNNRTPLIVITALDYLPVGVPVDSIYVQKAVGLTTDMVLLLVPLLCSSTATMLRPAPIVRPMLVIAVCIGGITGLSHEETSTWPRWVSICFSLGAAPSILGASHRWARLTSFIDSESETSRSTYDRCMEYFTVCNFLLSNALGAYVYYSFKYDATTAIRPAWTNSLP